MNCPAHHWVIGAASEGVLPARCKRCGAERTYALPGSVEDIPYWNQQGKANWQRRKEREKAKA